MKQPLAILLLFFSFVSAQETIAVIEFEAKGISQLEASALTDELEIKLSDIGGYIVVERGRAQEILNEQAFQQTGCVSSECAVEVGKILSVQNIVLGSITKVGNTFSVNAKIVDVKSGKILRTANYKHRGLIDDLLTEGMAEVAAQLSGKSVNQTGMFTTSTPPDLEPQTQPLTSTTTVHIPGVKKFEEVFDKIFFTIFPPDDTPHIMGDSFSDCSCMIIAWLLVGSAIGLLL